MVWLDVEETFVRQIDIYTDRLAKANEVRLYGYVLKRKNDDVLTTSFDFKVQKNTVWATEDDLEKADWNQIEHIKL